MYRICSSTLEPLPQLSDAALSSNVRKNEQLGNRHMKPGGGDWTSSETQKPSSSLHVSSTLTVGPTNNWMPQSTGSLMPMRSPAQQENLTMTGKAFAEALEQFDETEKRTAVQEHYLNRIAPLITSATE